MSEATVKRVKLFDLTAGEERLYRLCYPSRWLVPVKGSADDEFATFEYNTNELTPVTSIHKMGLADKLRLLVNAAGLYGLCSEYRFSLAPENLMTDINMQPKVLERDLLGEDAPGDFTEQYKALAGCILGPRYSFSDYLQGGRGLYRKKNSLKKIGEADSVGAVRALLFGQYRREEERLRGCRLVGRGRWRAMLIALPALFALTLAGAFAAWSFQFRTVPYQTALLDAGHYFLREDYDGAIDTLEKYDPMRLPKEERYRLAQAYVVSESLSGAQKRNVLSGLTLQTDDNLLIYWIQLGRLQYDAAIDTSKRLGDDELLLYALLKQEAEVQMDGSLSGEEKSTKLSALSKEISELQRGLEQKGTAVAAR